MHPTESARLPFERARRVKSNEYLKLNISANILYYKKCPREVNDTPICQVVGKTLEITCWNLSCNVLTAWKMGHIDHQMENGFSDSKLSIYGNLKLVVHISHR